MTMNVALFVTEGATRELPMPPWLFGTLALLAFTFLLGLTWSFRGTAQKHAGPVAHHQTGSGPAADGSSRTAYQAGHPQPEGDEAHWPEHPGQH